MLGARKCAAFGACSSQIAAAAAAAADGNLCCCCCCNCCCWCSGTRAACGGWWWGWWWWWWCWRWSYSGVSGASCADTGAACTNCGQQWQLSEPPAPTGQYDRYEWKYVVLTPNRPQLEKYLALTLTAFWLSLVSLCRAGVTKYPNRNLIFIYCDCFTDQQSISKKKSDFINI